MALLSTRGSRAVKRYAIATMNASDPAARQYTIRGNSRVGQDTAKPSCLLADGLSAYRLPAARMPAGL